MYIYYVIHHYNPKQGIGSVKLDVGIDWQLAKTGNVPVMVHPELDFHAINGDLFLRNCTNLNLVQMEPGSKIAQSRVYILAPHYKMALDLLRP